MKNTNVIEEPMGKNATLHLRIDAELKDQLTKLAKQQDRSASYVAEQAIRDRIAFEQAQVRAIEEGLAQANRGELIPHEEVKAWVESWGTENELPAPEPKSTA